VFEIDFQFRPTPTLSIQIQIYNGNCNAMLVIFGAENHYTSSVRWNTSGRSSFQLEFLHGNVLYLILFFSAALVLEGEREREIV
jgi:hypothetical protein